MGLARHRIRRSTTNCSPAGSRSAQVVGMIWHLLHGDQPPRLPRAQAGGQSRIGRRSCQASRQARPRALRHAAAAGPVADAGRQGPRPLDAVRRQRARAGQGVLEELPRGPERTTGAGHQGPDFIRHLLRAVYGEVDSRRRTCTRSASASCRRTSPPLTIWDEVAAVLGRAVRSAIAGPPLTGVKYLLTFRPFCQVARQRSAGPISRANLHLLPSPASLIFWARRTICSLQRELPLGVQVPLLAFDRAASGAARHSRVRNRAVMHEPRPARASEPQLT